MTTIPGRSSQTQQPSPLSSSDRGRPPLDGALLSPMALRLVACGTIGSLLFTAVYIIEGMTRPGYNPWQQAISALSLGPGGWIQQVNFVVFGLFLFAAAIGWRQALKGGIGATWFPICEAVIGLGLIMDGIFSQDPAPGYPPGVAQVSPTVHGIIHVVFAFVSITGLAASCFVLARRFAVEPRWRWWATYSVITGLLTIVFITLFGAVGAYGGLAGLFERVSTGVHSVWGLLILARLLLDRQRGQLTA